MLDYRFLDSFADGSQRSNGGAVGERSTSAILAYGLEANPSFIRKLMVPLTRDGIIVFYAWPQRLYPILAARRKRSPYAISTSPSSKIKALGVAS